jgi:hypothetical protein
MEFVAVLSVEVLVAAQSLLLLQAGQSQGLE